MNPSWVILADEQELEEAINESYNKPVAIFKHSTRCGVSRMALQRLERDWNFSSEDTTLYFLDLIANRNISNKIAELSGIEHQSPQIILYSQGKPVYHNSHSGISADELKEHLILLN